MRLAHKKKQDKSSDEEDVEDLNLERDDEEEEEIEETAAEKRLRLAKGYLRKVQEQVSEIQDGEIDAEEIDKELIASRLRDDVLERQHRQFIILADTVKVQDTRILNVGKAIQLSLTSCAFTQTGNDCFIYAGSKDATIVKWNLFTGSRVNVIAGGLKQTKKLIKQVGSKKIAHVGHTQPILAMDCTSDGQFMASSGMDKTIYVWSTVDDSLVGELKQHRDAVTGLRFRLGQHELYSCSNDRTIKLWNAPALSYIETLFGHQDMITSIDTLNRERCVTVGSRDRTARLWKIPEESQLVFRAGGGLAITDDLVVMKGLRKKEKKEENSAGGSVDAVAMLDEDHFLTGDDAGSISLWNVQRKKPVFTRLKAHGFGSKALVNGEEIEVQPNQGTTLTDDSTCQWISSIACFPYSDLFASGAGDGYVRFWKLSDTKQQFSQLFAVPVTGFVNDMRFFMAPPAPSEKSVATNDSSLAGKIREKERQRLLLLKQKKMLHLVMAVGQEHRLGRWLKIKKAKNQVMVMSLQCRMSVENP
ncbi:WD40-repeat-containing domain protein [Gorgonomyces haynaldii]|nr:WD40-repeat-containing domain protein [Gorgonomyces haynaldii]